MYYVDFSPYTYDTCAEYNPTLNIGWLDNQHLFITGSLSSIVLDRLWVFCTYIVHETLGFHTCDVCHVQYGIAISRNDKTLELGSAEIRVFGENVVFAAPDMIYHYVVDHKYSPPNEFINALMTSPLPYESSYQDVAARYRWY